MMRAIAPRAIGAPLIVEERPKPRAGAPVTRGTAIASTNDDRTRRYEVVDTGLAVLALAYRELRASDEGEHQDLAAIYVRRSLEPALATPVADRLVAHNALAARAHHELGFWTALRRY